jgi:hypothetical protein
MEQGLRHLNEPRPIPVRLTPSGNPASVQLHGEWLRVLAIQDVWRIDDEWWREPVSRRYYELELEHRGQLIVYQDLVSQEWFQQRY